MKPKVVISSFPIRNKGYFEWIYTGLQILEQEGKVEIAHEGHAIDRFLRQHPRVYGKFESKFPELSKYLFPVDQFSMFGRLELNDKKVRFAYDATDSPFTYALAHLELAEVYFKMQCPIQIEQRGFPLSTQVRIPYHPAVLGQTFKIRPCMSTGPITNTLNLKRNLEALELNAKRAVANKEIRMFASFGGDRGPKPWVVEDAPPAPHNYQNEKSIVTSLEDIVQHPNEKRAEIVRILRSWQKADVDARIWSSNDPAIQGDALSWSDYLNTVARSVFNVNVSGFRRSIPFRVLDSFQVGCGILSDNLGTRWYQDFDPEIELQEYGELGYESASNVNWEVTAKRLLGIYESIDLKENRSRAILEMFEKKWHPRALAIYFIDELTKVA